MELPYLLLFLLSQGTYASMLYNGAQKVVFFPDLTDACDAAFNTTIDCPENIIQYVTYPIQSVSQ